jgi:hypothetical protein
VAPQSPGPNGPAGRAEESGLNGTGPPYSPRRLSRETDAVKPGPGPINPRGALGGVRFKARSALPGASVGSTRKTRELSVGLAPAGCATPAEESRWSGPMPRTGPGTCWPAHRRPEASAPVELAERPEPHGARRRRRRRRLDGAARAAFGASNVVARTQATRSIRAGRAGRATQTAVRGASGLQHRVPSAKDRGGSKCLRGFHPGPAGRLGAWADSCHGVGSSLLARVLLKIDFPGAPR